MRVAEEVLESSQLYQEHVNPQWVRLLDVLQMNVLKVAPPLVIDERHADEFVRAITGVVDSMHNSASFWTEPLGHARRVINI